MQALYQMAGKVCISDQVMAKRRSLKSTKDRNPPADANTHIETGVLISPSQMVQVVGEVPLDRIQNLGRDWSPVPSILTELPSMTMTPAFTPLSISSCAVSSIPPLTYWQFPKSSAVSSEASCQPRLRTPNRSS